MRLMRALKCDASKGELSLEDVSIPEVILPDDIVIKVGYAGLCGTDLHIMQGEFAVCGSSKVGTLLALALTFDTHTTRRT